MSRYTQSGRAFSLTTPLDKDALLLESFAGVEGISRLFRFRLQLLAEQSVSFRELLGQPAAITLSMPNGSHRFVHGIIRRLRQGGWLTGPKGETTFLRYQAELVPALWLLTQRVQSRIFQQLSIPDILKKVLKDDWQLNVVFRLAGTYQPRNYCTQYQESDYAFVSRLMEAEGFCYFFEHTAESHRLLVTDSNTLFPELAAPASVPYDPKSSGWQGIPSIRHWNKRQRVRASKHTVLDRSFQLADKVLTQSVSAKGQVQLGSVAHELGQGSDTLEKVSHRPYWHRFDGIDPSGAEQPQELSKIFDYQAHLAKVHQERETARSLRVRGMGTAGHFVPGCTFTLARHFDAGGSYLLTKVKHRGSLGAAYVRGEKVDAVYENVFECMPAALPYRTACNSCRPKVKGTQTAKVVGPKGETIHVDKYGRVKVQFHWDDAGSGDGSDSCWVRVSQPWAGATWGSLTLPRVGQEVVVGFEQGDPDRPLILGSVYNSEQMPPYTLPEQRNQSGLVSSSGGNEKYHEIRLDDTAGSELLLLHSEKDLIHESENDHHVRVGNDHTITVAKDHHVTAGNTMTFEVSSSNSGSGGGSSGDWSFSYFVTTPESTFGNGIRIESPTLLTFTIYGILELTTGIAGNIVLGDYNRINIGSRWDWRVGFSWDISCTFGYDLRFGKGMVVGLGVFNTVHIDRKERVTLKDLNDVVKQMKDVIEHSRVVGKMSTEVGTQTLVTSGSQTEESATVEVVIGTDIREIGTSTEAADTLEENVETDTEDAASVKVTAVAVEDSSAAVEESFADSSFVGESFNL